jgi:5'-AMP-activated protein kinase catalytic alpha subunit
MVIFKLILGLLSDIWTCGIIFYATICGKLPFDDSNTQSLYKKILSGNFEIPNYLTDDAKILVKGLLTVNPNKRL